MPRRPRPGDPLRAVAYIRASRDDAKLGPEAQEAALKAWALREGARLVAMHVDIGVSGGAEMGDRPGLVAALGELRAAKAGVLLVARRDRLARDVGVAIAIERAVETSGARVVSADGAGNGTEAADQLLRTILDAAAAYERALIRARTRAALAQRKARGLRAGEVPFGYRDAGGGRLEPEPREQATLATLRKLRARGLTHRAIVVEAARLGLTSRAGTPLGRGHVARFLPRAGAEPSPSAHRTRTEQKTNAHRTQTEQKTNSHRAPTEHKPSTHRAENEQPPSKNQAPEKPTTARTPASKGRSSGRLA